MKRFVLALLLVGVAIFGYSRFAGWRAYGVCEKFAGAWAREDRPEAEKYGDVDAVRHAFDERSLRGTRPGAVMEAYRGSRLEIESKTRSGNGDFELVLGQTIFFDPPGRTTGIGGALFARFRDTATVRKTPEGWRVVAFEPVFLDMGEVRRGTR